MRPLAALTALLLLLLTGCTIASGETRDAAGKLRDALGTPDWASEVAITTGKDGQLSDFVQTTVTLKADATAEQITAFTAAFPRAVAKAGLGDGGSFRMLRFVQPEGSSLDMVPATSIDEAATNAAVVRWQGVALLALDSVQLEQETGVLTHTITAPDADSVGSTYDSVRADPSLATPADTWNVIYAKGGIDVEFADTTLPTDADMALWNALVAAAEKLPADLPRAELRLKVQDLAIVDLTVATPDDMTEDALTPEAYGDRLWPAFRGQLEALHAIDLPWVYTSQWAPVGTPTSTTILISLLDDQAPIDNGDVSTRWSQGAREYVDSL